MSEHQEGKKLELTFPTLSGDPFELTLVPGDRVFIVGANGSGKSAMMQHIVAQKPGNFIERIPAHRQTWFHTDSVDITARDRLNYSTNDFHQEMEDESRWTDLYAKERQSAVLFDLVNNENLRARTITMHVEEDDMTRAKETADAISSPFARINELLKIGNFAVSLEYSTFERLLAQHHNSREQYSIAQMSDGERSAVSIAARVLTVKPGTTLLIDEPERHLHPSISRPFLSALFQCRNDCAFVVSTNDISLPVAISEAHTLIVRSCTWNGNKASEWDLELLEASVDLPEDLKRAILGSRRRILFVEGDDSRSLDSQLYRTLFPSISVLPKGSCAEVMKAVKGLRGSESLHHVEAFGLIDRDNRPPDEVKKLEDDFVFALDVHSVEALYFCSDSISAVAQHQADSLMKDPEEMTMAAKESALDALREGGLAERMAAKWCERHVRNSLMTETPDWKTIASSPTATICASVPSPYPLELKRFQDLLADNRLEELVARYPLRESRVFDVISKALHLTGKETFEQTLLSKLQGNECLAHSLKQRIQSLTDALEM